MNTPANQIIKDKLLQFYDEYFDFVFRVAIIRTRHRADAEDLTQEVLLKILKNEKILMELMMKNEEQVRGYLARTVLNGTIEEYRKKSSRINRERIFSENKEKSSNDIDEEKRDDQRYAIVEAIKELPEKYQTVLMLKFFEDKSYQDLAKCLNIKEVSIRSIISRGLQMIKKKVQLTGIILSVSALTKELEATSVVGSNREFKQEVLSRIIDWNGENLILASIKTHSFFSKILMYFTVLLGVVGGSILVYPYILNQGQPTEDLPLAHQAKENPLMEKHRKPKFSAKYIFTGVGSKEQFDEKLKELAYVKGVEKNMAFPIKNGFYVNQQNPIRIGLPYHYRETPFSVELNFNNLGNFKKLMYVAHNLQINSPSKDMIFKKAGARRFMVRYFFINRGNYFESNFTEGFHAWRVNLSEFNKQFEILVNYMNLESIEIKELDEIEVAAIKSKAPVVFEKMEAFIKSSKK